MTPLSASSLLSQDAFAIFGLPRQFSVLTSELRSRYTMLLREHHPDHQTAGDTASATLISARINDAWAILAEPISRAQELLRLSGFEQELSRRDVSTDFLHEQLIYREKIDDADTATLIAVEQEIDSRARSCLQAIADFFSTPTINAEQAQAIGHCIRQAQFWRKLREEIDDKINAHH